MRKITAALLAVLIMAACSSIDCPLNNAVYTKCRLAGTVTRLTDTLTVSAARGEGSDTVLLNRALPVDSFVIPLSYRYETDVLYLDIRPEAGTPTIDPLTVTKTNEPHFEAVDCPASMFHTLGSVTCTHHRIDSVAINYPKVSYDTSKAHLLIYFKALSD